MLRIALTVSLPFVLVGATSADPPAADERKALEGEWRYVSMESQGKKLSKGDVGFKPSWQIVISGNELTWNGRKKTFTVDSTKLPKEMDIVSLDGSENGQTHAAIYKLEGDRLTICMPYFNGDNATRSTDFTATAENGRMLVVLERVKP